MRTNVLMMFMATVVVGFMPLCASAKPCALVINSNDQMKFDKSELRFSKKSCPKITLRLNHTGKLAKQIMGHNWVLSETENMQTITTEALKAGPKKDYLPDDRSKIIAHTKMLGGGENDTITIKTSQLKKGGSYSYFCSFPGHAALMKGKLIVE